MATGWPMKTTYANGDVYSASDVNDITGTINLLTSSTLSVAAAKNCVINGGYDFWQRGTSVALTSSLSNFVTDRFYSYRGGSVTGGTVSRQVTGDTTNLPSIQYCARVQRDNGNTSTQPIAFVSDFESVNSIPYAGKTVTLSFYARKGALYSPTSSALGVTLFSGTGTDQRIASGYTGSATPISQTATLTTTWQRFSYTGTIASTATQLGVYFLSTPTGTAGATDFYEVTGVQLELGSTATTFSRAGGTIQGELAACQRYFYSVNYLVGTKAAYNVIANGRAVGTTSALVTVTLPVSMRVAPTSIAYGGNIAVDDGSTAPNLSALTINQGATNNTLLSATVTGVVANRPVIVYTNNDATAYVHLSAEL